jgi:hypothetical protein
MWILMVIDRRLPFTMRKQLGLTLTKMYWLLGRQSNLSPTNKLYKTILKPIWTYGIQLWGTASTSDIEIRERFQSKACIDLLYGLVVRVPGYIIEMYCVSCEVRTEFIYVM